MYQSMQQMPRLTHSPSMWCPPTELCSSLQWNKTSKPWFNIYNFAKSCQHSSSINDRGHFVICLEPRQTQEGGIWCIWQQQDHSLNNLHWHTNESSSSQQWADPDLQKPIRGWIGTVSLLQSQSSASFHPKQDFHLSDRCQLHCHLTCRNRLHFNVFWWVLRMYNHTSSMLCDKPSSSNHFECWLFHGYVQRPRHGMPTAGNRHYPKSNPAHQGQQSNLLSPIRNWTAGQMRQLNHAQTRPGSLQSPRHGRDLLPPSLHRHTPGWIPLQDSIWLRCKEHSKPWSLWDPRHSPSPHKQVTENVAHIDWAEPNDMSIPSLEDLCLEAYHPKMPSHF